MTDETKPAGNTMSPGSDFKRSGRRGPRILCLHGMGSNNGITAIQAANLGLESKYGFACDLLHAVTEVAAQDDMIEMLSAGPYYSWFDLSLLPWRMAATGSPGGSLHASLNRVMNCIEQHGPYEGIFGFSQGALMVTCLSSEASWRKLFGLSACPWRFVICANPGGVVALKSIRLGGAPIERPLSIPSFHLIGQWDWHRALGGLLSWYMDGASHTHAYGHELPMTLAKDEALHQALRSFFERVRAPSATCALRVDERVPQHASVNP